MKQIQWKQNFSRRRFRGIKELLGFWICGEPHMQVPAASLTSWWPVPDQLPGRGRVSTARDAPNFVSEVVYQRCSFQNVQYMQSVQCQHLMTMSTSLHIYKLREVNRFAFTDLLNSILSIDLHSRPGKLRGLFQPPTSPLRRSGCWPWHGARHATGRDGGQTWDLMVPPWCNLTPCFPTWPCKKCLQLAIYGTGVPVSVPISVKMPLLFTLWMCGRSNSS